MPRMEEYRGLALAELRERVMDELAGQFSSENIGMDEYDERCGKAALSDRREDLLALVADLPARGPDPSNLPAARPRPSGAPVAFNSGRVAAHDPIINIFFGSERKGVWRPAKRTEVINIFGGTQLDLRDAIFPPGGLTIEVICVFGGCEIILPEGVNAEVRGIGVFGGFSRNLKESESDEEPLVRVNGVSVFGGCEVKTGRRRGN